MYINETRRYWDKSAQYYSHYHNTTPSAYHNYTLVELVVVHKGNLPEWLNKYVFSPVYNVEAYYQEVRYKLQLANKRVKKLLNKKNLNRFESGS